MTEPYVTKALAHVCFGMHGRSPACNGCDSAWICALMTVRDGGCN